MSAAEVHDGGWDDAPPPTDEDAWRDGYSTIRPVRTQAPPHDSDAEEALIGACLVSASACDAALTTSIAPGDFYGPTCSAVFAAICDVIIAGQKPDAITVAAALTPDMRARVDDGRALLGWIVGVPTVENARAYATRILNTARLRRLMAASIEVTDAARSGNLDEALDRLAALDATVPTVGESSWVATDLAAILDGNGPPEPTMLARDDGQHLLYPGKVHLLAAESESGKSWLAIWACVERLDLGEHVLYLDFEDDASSVVSRLRALGVDPDSILERFHYVRPDERLDTVAKAQLDRLLVDHHPTLVVIDGVTEVMVANGWSIGDNDDVAAFLLALPRPIARHGAAVVMIDHVVKDKEQRGRNPIGAQHKLAGIDGAAYSLEVTAPFGRGREGAARITVTKDRPGHVRGASVEGRFVGEMRLRSLVGEDNVLLQLNARSNEAGTPQVRPTNLMEKVSRVIEEHNHGDSEPTSSVVAREVGGKRARVLEALRRLTDEGYVTATPGARNSAHHRSVRPYRAAEDPGSDSFHPPTDEPPSDYHHEDF